MPAVIEVLREEHRNIGLLLEALERQIAIFGQGSAPDYDVIVGIADYFLEYPDRCHHPKEDAVFSHLRQKDPREAAAIGDLSSEHRVVQDRARRFRDTVDAFLNETDIARAVIIAAARQFINDERLHMQIEEERFFSAAERLLVPADWFRINRELKQRRDPLFGGMLEEKFRKLSERLISWEREFH